MATILERFKETSRQAFHHAKDADDSSFPTVDQPVVKDETSLRYSCPFTSEGKQNEEELKKDDLVGEKLKDNLTTPLSPEFLMGSSQEMQQDGKTIEGSNEPSNKLFSP